VVEPEQKRKIIGNTFIEVFEREARLLGIEGHLLGQGTIYPTRSRRGARSGPTPSRRITTRARHRAHDRTGPRRRTARRPLQGGGARTREKLGIPHSLVWRHPFPGPGLGVRLLCSTGEAHRDGLAEIEPKVAEIARQFGVAALAMPIKSVGVKADLRSYEHPVLVSGEAPWQTQLELAASLFRHVPASTGASGTSARRPGARDTAPGHRDARTPRSPARGGPSRDGRPAPPRRLRRDLAVPDGAGALEVDGRGREFVIVRPIHSERAMTATPARLPEALVADLQRQILPLPGVSGLALDVTTKPPGTIEWSRDWARG